MLRSLRTPPDLGAQMILFFFGATIGMILTLSGHTDWYEPYRELWYSYLEEDQVSSSFLPTVARVYSAVYCIAIPLSINSIFKEFDKFGVEKRLYLIHNAEFNFQLKLIPIFLIYCLVLLFTNTGYGANMIFVLVFICYSIYRLFRYYQTAVSIIIDPEHYIREVETANIRRILGN